MKSFKQFIHSIFHKEPEEAEPEKHYKTDEHAPAYPEYEGKDRIGYHIHHLEHTMGYPEFHTAFKNLSNDKTMKQPQMAQLHQRWMGHGAKSMSRKTVLSKVMGRHQNLWTAKVKSDSRDGRSAA